jgi:hypothetical protein
VFGGWVQGIQQSLPSSRCVRSREFCEGGGVAYSSVQGFTGHPARPCLHDAANLGGVFDGAGLTATQSCVQSSSNSQCMHASESLQGGCLDAVQGFGSVWGLKLVACNGVACKAEMACLIS